MAKISKNVYNSSIYCIQIFNKFKYKIFKKLFFQLKSNPNINTSQFIKNELLTCHQIYSNIKQHIQSNNNYIYKTICYDLKISNTNIKNSNINYLTEFYIWKFKTDPNIFLDSHNNYFLLNDNVIRIIRSFYTRCYLRTKNEMLEHKKFTIKDQEIINDVKNGNIMSWSNKNKYKKLIEAQLKIKLKSDKNYIGRLVYATLGDIYGKLDSTMIGYVFSEAYKSYNLYYKLLSKGKKAGQPKFLKKDDTFKLTYFVSKISKDYDPLTDTIKYNLFAGDYISKNFKKIIGSKYIKLSKYKYVHKKYLKKIHKKSTSKTRSMSGFFFFTIYIILYIYIIALSILKL